MCRLMARILADKQPKRVEERAAFLDDWCLVMKGLKSLPHCQRFWSMGATIRIDRHRSAIPVADSCRNLPACDARTVGSDELHPTF